MADNQTMRNILYSLLTFCLVIFIYDASANVLGIGFASNVDMIDGDPMEIRFNAGDESQAMPATAVADTAGTFAVASRKGVLLGTSGEKGCYFPLCNFLGLAQFDEVNLVIIAHDQDLSQPALEVRVPNTPAGGYKIGVNTLEIRELGLK